MAYLFDHPILCNTCNKKMEKGIIKKSGCSLRAVRCPECGKKIIHPLDKEEYNKFKNLKNKEYHVKMRMVGNSYAVSIPKEIVSFLKEQEKVMDNMVKMCFEDFGRISLRFKRHKKNGKKGK